MNSVNLALAGAAMSNPWPDLSPSRPMGEPYPSNLPSISQKKRRKLNRSTGSNKKSMKKHIYGFASRRFNWHKNHLKEAQKCRLDKKNERRAINGLSPLTSYSQV